MLADLLESLRDTPRLRWGLALIVGIAWLYSTLLLRDTLAEQGQQYRATSQRISRLRAQLQQPEWAERAGPAKTLAVQLESRLWQAATAGLAQGAFQDWLNAGMAKAALLRPQISVTVADEDNPGEASGAAAPAPGAASLDAKPGTAATPDAAGNSGTTDLWKVKAKLTYELPPGASPAEFLNLLASHDKQIIVNSATVRKEPTPRVELELIAYFQKQSTPANATRPKSGP